jgi:hypothetical protein
VSCHPTGRAVCTDGEHPAWCSAEHCYVTDEGVRVHEQAPTRWEDDTAEVRCESQLRDQLTKHLDAVQ